MNNHILTRMGDGAQVSIPVDEVKEDILSGTRDSAERGKIPELNPDEVEHLLDIFMDPNRAVSVIPGNEVIVTDDACSMTFYADQENSGLGIPMSRPQSVLAFERACAADTVCMGHTDFSYKPVKSIINYEAQEYYTTSLTTTVPLFYGAQPNMGLYFQPDGPFPNPAELLPMGKIKEAQEAQVIAAEQLNADLVFIGKVLYNVGCEGINFDTSGSSGDADFLATLNAVKELKKAAPDMAIEVGAASEFVLGMHGEIEFGGKRLAGMYPHDQVKVVEDAGADIFGPAINVNTTKSTPWNLSRAVTFVKAAVEAANIPVHPNVGMGVCGVPMFEVPPIDAVTRTSKALVEIGKADGL